MDETYVKNLSREVDVKYSLHSIDDVIHYLKIMRKNDEYICFNYEGEKFYSMLDDKDSVCQKLLGVDFKQYKKARNAMLKEFRMEEIETELKRLEEMPTWIERGNKIIPEYKQKAWKKTVKSSIKDLYKGSDLADALAMMEALHEGEKNYDEIIDILKNSNASGGSATSSLYIVANFAEKGPDLFRYENNKRGVLKIRNLDEYLDKIEQENAKHKEEGEIENE